jgi:hypothetical protein
MLRTYLINGVMLNFDLGGVLYCKRNSERCVVYQQHRIVLFYFKNINKGIVVKGILIVIT